ncbi:MAG: ABC transporter permease, partial [Candidatus Saccharimonas sp.]|nr:ABC transporter permease [Planctomycetaceae bacterium]
MSPEFRSLLMKEWAERRSLFRLALVYVVVFLGYCVAYEFEYRTRALVASFYATSLTFSCLAAVLLAMSTATGEYSRRTLKFSQSLPVSLSKVAWARLLGAWGCQVVPIVCGAVLITLLLASGLVEQAGLRSDTARLPDRPSLSRLEAIGFLWVTAAIAVVAAMHLTALLSLLGTRCRNEGTVGFLGAIVVLFSMVLVTIRSTLDSLGQYFLSDWIGGVLPLSLAINWGSGELDGSTYTDLELAPLLVGPIIVSLLVTMALAAWFTRRYGCRLDVSAQPAKPRRRWLPRVAMPALVSRLGIRWPGRVAALTWLDARQSVPLSLAGLAIAVLITLISLGETQVSLGETQGRGTLAARFAGELPSSTWFVGVLWAAVVAVGIFSSELKPGLEHFWRSRPISPGAWFWTKFAVGLIAVLGALDGIPALLAWNSPHQRDAGRMGMVYLACMPLLHTQVYAMAVAAICRLRRAIPAAMIALLLFFVIDAVLSSIPGHAKLSTINVFNSLEAAERAGERLDLMSEGYPIVYGIVAAVILGATLFARRTLIPPRASKRVVSPAILLGLCYACCLPETHGAEPPTASEIVAGMRQREALVRDVRMRLKTHIHRTDAFFANYAADLSASTRHRRRSAATPALPRDLESNYELFERLPCRAWTEFGPDGDIKSIVAFDGAIQRQFTSGSRRSSMRSVSIQAYEFSALRPDSGLMSCGGISLIDLLSMAEHQGSEILNSSISEREVDGERLIDVSFTRSVNTTTAVSMITAVGVDDLRDTRVSHEHRYQVTVNATRHYWPVRVQLEVAE